MADAHFLAWRRRGGAAIGAGGGRRPVLQLTVNATDDAGGSAGGSPTLLLHGPGDVTALQPGAVTATFPRPGQVDVEPDYCAYAELAAPDLPWRYSPTGGSTDAMVPWLALVVARLGGDSPEVEVLGRTAIVQPSALPDPTRPTEPTDVSDGAHVQCTPATANGHEVARLLCLRPLDANKAYLAMVVPVFRADGSRRWVDGGGAVVSLPVYASWSFQTGADETFETLAKALHAADAIDDFGRIGIDVGAGMVEARGALTAIHAPADPPPPPGPTARLAELLSFDPDAAPPPHEAGTDREGRRYVRPPEYGDAWLRHPLDGAAGGGWVDQVNRDLRHRAVAGLGLQAGVDLQDELAAAAAARFGATLAANGRLGALVTGLRIAGSLWDRRLPVDRNERIRLLGLSAARIPSVDETDPGRPIYPLLGRSAGAGRTLPKALFSSVGQRVLRRRAARLRHAAADWTNMLSAANAERSTVRRPDEAPGDPRYHDGVAHGDAMVADLGDVGMNGRRATNGDELVAAQLDGRDLPEGAREAIEELLGAERPTLRPTDLDRLDDALVRAFDPRGDPPAIRRVRATIHPDESSLAPREPCPDLDLPAWRYLRDRQREWLLPGAHTLQDGEVVGLASNPAFVDSLLLGMNTQTLGELRWRGLPVASGCTPLRRFWDSYRSTAGGYEQDQDIAGVLGWLGLGPGGVDRRSAPLGDGSHAPDPAMPRSQLVVAFATDLFRRYPGTLVYLAPQTPGPPWEDADTSAASRILPSFTARITQRLVLFAFPVLPAALDTLWVVVEQQPPGIRFDKNKLAGPPTSSAAAASAMLVRPVRVLLAGDLLSGAV